MPKTIFDDERTIQMVVAFGDDGASWRVGYKECTKIVPYREAGQMAYVTWLAVYKGNDIVTRVNCAGVEFIDYDELEIESAAQLKEDIRAHKDEQLRGLG